MSLLNIKTQLSGLIFIILFCFSNFSHAAFIIDNFTDFQKITDDGLSGSTTSTPMALTSSSSDLTGIKRTLTAEATGGGFGDETILIGEPAGPGTGGKLAISNNTYSSGSVSILWSGFGPTDFTSLANTILLEVLTIDLSVRVQMIVNGTSSSNIQNFASTENFFFDFADFSQPGVFNAVDRLELIMNGPAGWDGQFRLIASHNPATAVPEPSSLALLAMTLASFKILRKSK